MLLNKKEENLRFVLYLNVLFFSNSFDWKEWEGIYGVL